MSQSQHLSGGIRSSEKGVGKLLAVRFLLRHTVNGKLKGNTPASSDDMIDVSQEDGGSMLRSRAALQQTEGGELCAKVRRDGRVYAGMRCVTHGSEQ
ncbi:hypothetical protein JCM24511_02439 [Saitozyma sp. JCM 24511]|nr:hypothetical protein JCM24511_02439 [Saitozyma sp. JCM 24511]